MVVGNAGIIDALRRVKSNLDSGIPQAIQQAAIEALTGPQDCVTEHNTIYKRRRDRLLQTLNQIGLKARPPSASLYIWARVPAGYTSLEFATSLLDDAGVVVTPGISYGKYGEGYIRLSLTVPDQRLEEALARLRAWHKQYLT
jgi:LL-diaminopimelate aminotransferase